MRYIIQDEQKISDRLNIAKTRHLRKKCFIWNCKTFIK